MSTDFTAYAYFDPASGKVAYIIPSELREEADVAARHPVALFKVMASSFCKANEATWIKIASDSRYTWARRLAPPKWTHLMQDNKETDMDDKTGTYYACAFLDTIRGEVYSITVSPAEYDVSVTLFSVQASDISEATKKIWTKIAYDPDYAWARGMVPPVWAHLMPKEIPTKREVVIGDSVHVRLTDYTKNTPHKGRVVGIETSDFGEVVLVELDEYPLPNPRRLHRDQVTHYSRTITQDKATKYYLHAYLCVDNGTVVDIAVSGSAPSGEVRGILADATIFTCTAHTGLEAAAKCWLEVARNPKFAWARRFIPDSWRHVLNES